MTDMVSLDPLALLPPCSRLTEIHTFVFTWTVLNSTWMSKSLQVHAMWITGANSEPYSILQHWKQVSAIQIPRTALSTRQLASFSYRLPALVLVVLYLLLISFLLFCPIWNWSNMIYSQLLMVLALLWTLPLQLKIVALVTLSPCAC
jgi:hypothetical protein